MEADKRAHNEDAEAVSTSELRYVALPSSRTMYSDHNGGLLEHGVEAVTLNNHIAENRVVLCLSSGE